MIKLFIVGFPRDMDEMRLAQLFGPYGDIELLTIMRDKITGHSKGFGFIQMKDADGAFQAMEALNGFEFGDRKMEVRLAEEKQEPAKRPVAKRPPPRFQQKTLPEVKKKRPRLSK
jgi:RNA recognition motif-containing protein